MARQKKRRKNPSDQPAREANNVQRAKAGKLPTPKCDPSMDPKCEDMEIEHYFAVEWGERLESSKAIARGGKSDGYVPGAMGQFP